MAKKKRGAPGGPTAESHIERATSVVTGQPILIRCDCPIGHDHTYGEWQERFGAGVFRD